MTLGLAGLLLSVFISGSSIVFDWPVKIARQLDRRGGTFKGKSLGASLIE